MPQTILIVEDTEWSRVALEIALTAVDDLAVRAVETAEEAIEFLASNGICAVITDLDLPGMDGFALIETIRAQPRQNRLPIVVVSGDTDPATPARLRSLGADAFFSKPYSPAELRRKLEQLLDAD
jgi:two-component system, chemotaxis family, chemotaxis protein CheY